MSTVAKDPRINYLFTEGSHHRNLTVIAINQNLYYSKDPTQRRNCHYIALFNIPINKQQIMTLARQMYPDNTQYFMDKFKEDTAKPFGYLLVDLKPTTPEHLRLRYDIIDQTPRIRSVSENSCGLYSINVERSIKDDQVADESHFIDDTPSEQTYSEELSEEMPSCDDCGLMFETMHDLQRHIKQWCPENKSLKRKRDEDDEDIPDKKSKFEWIPYESEEEELFNGNIKEKQ